jgi:alpha-L-fucosidase 2
MLEAIIQSRRMPDATEIELLPALPAQCSDGSISGVHVRGGAIVDLNWKHGIVVAMIVHAQSDRKFRLILPSG